MRYILHIIAADDWAKVSHWYRPESLKTENFIHCSTVDQVLLPANEFFKGTTGLVLLVIDTTLVDAPIKFEDCYETGTLFPHIYGPLAKTAVCETILFPTNKDGRFSRPAELERYVTFKKS